jgi:PAS domain S-box-containing protein
MISILIEKYPGNVLIVKKSEGIIVDANPSALDFYGYKSHELVGMPLSKVNMSMPITIDEDPETKCDREKHFFSHVKKSGEIIDVEVLCQPIEHENEVYMFLIISKRQLAIRNDENIVSAFLKSEDAICIVDKESLNANVIMTNLAFNKLVEYDDSDQFLSLNHVLTLSSENLPLSQIQGKIRPLNSRDELQVTVNSIRIRYGGKDFYVLSISPINYFSLTSDLNMETLSKMREDKKLGKKGYLAELSIFINTSSPTVFKLITHQLEQRIRTVLLEREIEFVLLNDFRNIFIFSDSLLSELYVALSMIVEQVNSSGGEDEKYQCKLRVGISSQSEDLSRQIKDLNEIMGTFNVHEYDVIHVHAKKDNYHKAQAIKNEILKAIDGNEFVLYAQPIVNMEDSSIEGFEMLIRWQHAEYGLIMPSEFLPYAEFTGEIYNIDLWVVENSFKFIRENIDLCKEFIFHINVSTKTLSKPGFVDHITQLSKGVIIKNIVFEITEDPSTHMMDDVIDKIRELGYQLAIDDFGKGYSSFERIRNIGIEYVKIDKSFIDGLTDNVDDILILKAIIGMCSNLNIKVIAEGIEKVEQLEFLYSRKCYRIQGYIFAKPASVELLESIVSDLKKHVSEQVGRVMSEEVSSKKFYSNGRIVLQDIDSDFNLLTPNVSLAEYLDYDFEDFVNMKMIDFIPTQYHRSFTRFAQSLEDDIKYKTIMIHIQTRLKKRVKVIMVIQKKKIVGQYRLYIEFLDNIEEMEIELLGLSHSYLQAFDEAPSGMMIVSDSFHIKKWNLSCEKIYGYSQKEVIGQNIIKLIANQDQVKSMNLMFNSSLKEGIVERVIETVDRHEERIITRWHVSTIFDEIEQTHQYICIVNDITESIKKSRELMKINHALDQSESVIIMTDVDGCFEYANHKFYEITGYEMEEIIGASTSILSSGEQSDDFYKSLWLTITSGNVWEGEFHNKVKDGSYYWCKATIYPIKEEGQIAGFVGIQVDTTKEKELVSMNNNLKTKLLEQDKVASLGLLSSGIMHEINNPLSFIQGNVKYLIELMEDFASLDEEDLDELRETIVDIDNGVSQIKTIADGLKKYIFKGAVDEKEEMKLVDEINSVLVLSKNEYKYHAQVNFEYDTNLMYSIFGYASKIKQVLMNLIINAAHAIKSMEYDSLGQIGIQLKETPTEVWIIVSDNGCGMDEVTIEKIYEPLFTTKEKGIGSGLGLSVSRQIIEEDHNGLIICESEVGVGTTFTLKLKKE